MASISLARYAVRIIPQGRELDADNGFSVTTANRRNSGILGPPQESPK
jgi:hypothetical protein